MAKFQVIKQIDFGNYTIQGPTGLQSDQVPINNYAPKIGDVIEGNIVTQPVSDGNGHTVTMTGIIFPIMTNGAQSTTGQTSIKFIPQDYFTPYVEPVPVFPVNGTPCSSPAFIGSLDGTYINGICVPNLPKPNISKDNTRRNIALVVIVAIIIIFIAN